VTGEYHEKLKSAQPVFGRIYKRCTLLEGCW